MTEQPHSLSEKQSLKPLGLCWPNNESLDTTMAPSVVQRVETDEINPDTGLPGMAQHTSTYFAVLYGLVAGTVWTNVDREAKHLNRV